MSELTGDPYGYGAPSSRRGRSPLATAIGAAAALGAIVALAGWAHGLMTRDPGEIPFLRAEDGPMKVAPTDPGGLELGDADAAVTRIMAGDAAPEPDLAPAPEAPADEDLPLPRLADAPPPGETVTAVPAPMEAEPDAEAGPDDGPSPIDAAVAAVLREAAETDDAPAAAPGGTEQAPSAAPVAPKRPAARPAPAAERTEAVAAAPLISLGAGDVAVQLGAFDSEAIAEAQWRRHMDRNEDLLGRFVHAVTTVRSGGRTLYRLRAGPLPTGARAQELCEALKARGDACIVARIR